MFANVSAGADTKASATGWVRAPRGLLERLQRRIAFEPLCERGSSFRTELIAPETAGVGVEVGVQP